ncbi:hypothetical protein [Kordia sp.]|uniref:hypothetical protein n=1 Tax=Kordia sp. TaxID=1965332 RepID=UPI003D6B8B07
MKKVTISLLLLLFVFYCQKEDVRNEEETATDIMLKSLTTTAPSTSYTEREIMEINLRWTAYITGYVLRHDTAARHQVAALLQNGNRVIKLSDVLVENTAFDDGFKNYLIANFSGGNQTSPEPPKGRPNPPPPGIYDGDSFPSDTGTNPVDHFINYILTDNCIELYFPKSMVFSAQFTITSTGHSMTDKNFNDGAIRYYDEQFIDGEYTITDNVIMNDTYILNNDNIIIARPYRNSLGPRRNNCNYSQYDDITDFTDFLDY